MSIRTIDFILRHSAIILLVLAVITFGLGAPEFLELRNLLEIITQSSSLIILATGMTFALLVAGVDLSVGSIMYVGAAIAATLILNGVPAWIALPAFLVAGALFGALNALFVARLAIMPFIVTLAMLFIGRGVGHLITNTRAMNLPESFLNIGSRTVLGLPIPVLVALGVVATAQITLGYTNLGKGIYAVGFDQEMARKAGYRPQWIIAFCYLVSGVCAGVAGIVSLAQLGTVAPNFGFEREFMAIAAAVIGGASLFGGIGKVFPGAIVGALLLQATESGLVAVNVDPYLYPIVYAAIIFLAVGLDSLRRHFDVQARVLNTNA